VDGGDHRARGEVRREARRLPLLPQRLGHGLDLHGLQDPGPREPRLHADLHQRAPAEGLRPRPRGCQGAGRGHAGRLGDPQPRRGGGRGGQRRAGLRLAHPHGRAQLGPGHPVRGRRRHRRSPGLTMGHHHHGKDGDRAFERPSPRPAGVRPLGAPGQVAVDYEHRVDFARLREYRLGRAKAALEASGCGAFLLFDFYNIRYTTQTWIGGALGDKMIRYALILPDREPILWDFGSAVRHHQIYSDWMPTEHQRPGFLGFRGAVAPEGGAELMKDAVAEIKSLLVEAGVADMPLGLDIVEPPFLFELERQGIRIADAQQPMLDARVIKNQDEIMLLNQAAAMVDGVYQDIVDALRPGVRENEIVALANKRLYEYGSDQVEAVNAISGERCNPHPHNFTDRIIRPGD